MKESQKVQLPPSDRSHETSVLCQLSQLSILSEGTLKKQRALTPPGKSVAPQEPESQVDYAQRVFNSLTND